MEFAEIRLILDVADFAASVYFYQDLLGLQPVSSWEKEEGPGIILKAGGGRTIELFGPPPGASHPAQLTTAVKLGLQVEDLDAVYRRLEDAGVPIAREIVDNPWGDRSFGIDDPNGVRVWLYQVTDPAYKAALL